MLTLSRAPDPVCGIMNHSLHYASSTCCHSFFFTMASNAHKHPAHGHRLASSHEVARPPIMKQSLEISASAQHQQIDEAVASRPSPHFNALDGLHKTINNSGEVIMVAFWLTTGWVQANKHLGYSMAVWGFVGATLNHMLSKWLKGIIKQPRPGKVISNTTNDPQNLGMPSSHAQSLAYLGAYSFLGGSFVTISWNVGDCCKLGVLMALLSYMAWLRVREGCHTFMQVIVGGFFGTFFAILWFSCYDLVLV